MYPFLYPQVRDGAAPARFPEGRRIDDEFDAANGRFVPNAQLRAQYPAEAR